MSIYDFSVKTIDGHDFPLSQCRGKVVLIVNTASKCGFTPQYEELERLYEAYREQGFSVLGFPCNQFKEQEPGSDGEILEFCRKNYGVTFPLFSKIDVKGPAAAPLYRYLTGELGFQGFDPEHPLSGKLNEILSAENPQYREDDSVKWNFTKFLINREGEAVARYEPTAAMETVEHGIKEQLS